MSFENLFVDHVQQTICYNEATFNQDSESQKQSVQALTANAEIWGRIFGPDFKKLLMEHILLAKDLIDAKMACRCGTDALFGHCDNAEKSRSILDRLVQNGKSLVAVWAQQIGHRKDLQYFWDQHLTCTNDYITALSQCQFSKYDEKIKICLDFGHQLGEFLDQLHILKTID